MKVCAAPGLRVPTEGNPHAYITQDEAVDVAETYYNLRRVADGDLVIVDGGEDASAAVKNAKTAAKKNASNTKE